MCIMMYGTRKDAIVLNILESMLPEEISLMTAAPSPTQARAVSALYVSIEKGISGNFLTND